MDEFGRISIKFVASAGTDMTNKFSSLDSNSIRVNSHFYPEFKEIADISIVLTDNIIYLIRVSYPDKLKWGAYKVFAEHIATSFDLPNIDDWQHGAGMATIDCNSFSLQAGFVADASKNKTKNDRIGKVNETPFIILKDLEIDRLIKQRQEIKQKGGTEP